MIVQRMITGVGLGACSVVAIYGLSADIFRSFLLLILLAASFEYWRLCKIKTRFAQTLLTGAALFVCWTGWSMLDEAVEHRHAVAQLVATAGSTWWLFAFFLVASYQRGKRHLTQGQIRQVIFSLLSTLPAFVLAGWLQKENPNLLLLCLLIVWGVDIGGYVIGKKWGRHKLTANVSPNKTWEGAFGGVVLGVVFACIFAYFRVPGSLFYYVLMALFVGASSIVGDLFESVYKRNRAVANSGTLLGAHGGILDRIDSTNAALPVFALFI